MKSGYWTPTPVRTFLILLPLALSVTADAYVLDAGGDGKEDALTDGIPINRYLLGRSGDALTMGVLAQGAPRDDTAIEEHLAGARNRLDLDGDGTSASSTDGLLILRYLFGFTGEALIAGAVAPGAYRLFTGKYSTARGIRSRE